MVCLLSLYMLKSFTLKQYDLVRQEAYDEIAKGNVLKGTKNLEISEITTTNVERR